MPRSKGGVCSCRSACRQLPRLRLLLSHRLPRDLSSRSRSPCNAAARPTGAGRFRFGGRSQGPLPRRAPSLGNTEGKSQILSLRGHRWYGTTKEGAYMREADAGAAGYHASRARRNSRSRCSRNRGGRADILRSPCVCVCLREGARRDADRAAAALPRHRTTFRRARSAAAANPRLARFPPIGRNGADCTSRGREREGAGPPPPSPSRPHGEVSIPVGREHQAAVQAGEVANSSLRRRRSLRRAHKDQPGVSCPGRELNRFRARRNRALRRAPYRSQ